MSSNHPQRDMLQFHYLANAVLLAKAVLGVLILATGCSQKNSPTEISVPDSAKTPQVSQIPLRIWIVEPSANVELVRRQWQSVSEQPIELEVLSTASFLARPSCNCDIVVYPARLLGELVKRAWLTKVRNKPAEPSTAGESAVNVVPVAWLAQCRYGGDTWARPLGCSVPILLGDSRSGLSAQAAVKSWAELLKRTANENSQAAQSQPVQVAVDHDALVDRFLTIAGSLSQRNPKFGILFEMQTMRARIGEAEFIQAAETLRTMARASRGGVAATGSWNQTWAWLMDDGEKSLSIGLAGQTEKSTQPTNTIRVAIGPSSMNVLGSEEKSASNFGWNTGSGLIASLSESCRQSSRADQFVEWLATPATRNILSKAIVGIDPDAPVSGPDASDWQVASLKRRLANRVGLPMELRFPGAERYRAALGQQLARILERNAEIADGLKQVAAEWEKLTDELGRKQQRTQYEHSLGLL